MIIWIIRTLVLIASPVISYYYILRNPKGMLIGFSIALVFVLVEIIIQAIPLDTIIAGILGIIFGLIGAKLLDYIVFLTNNDRLYEWFKNYSLLIQIIFAYFGLVIAIKKKSELDLLDQDIFRKRKTKKINELILLDTSALIDGRITDITETKFLSGAFIVPRFVLQELQTLADSSDTHKRNRARRGLDIIAQLQKDESVTIKIVDKDYSDITGVDAKLLALSKELDAKIITTDFNLNKVAALQGVTVLNINDLSNALKPIYLPGERMPLFVVKEGKERSQGIGYLDDGTMVVVEEGRKYVGKRIDVIVNSILQTSSGRMVFTKFMQEHRDNNE